MAAVTKPNVTLITGAVVVVGLVVVGAGGQALGLETHPYVAGLVATFAGVAGGLPVALWLDRRRVQQENRDERAEEHARQTRVRALLTAELEEALKALDGLPNTPWSVRPPFLGSHVWSALSVSGEIRGLSAPLLAKAARAYRMIEATAEVQRDVFRIYNDPSFPTDKWGPGVRARDQLPPVKDAMNLLVEMREFSKVAIQGAIDDLRSAAS
jgi:hypothetical protein